MYRLWDASVVETDHGDFGKTWMTWADILVTRGSGDSRIRFDSVRKGATISEPRSELEVVEEATYKGNPLLVLSNEAAYDASDKGQQAQTVFVLQFDEYEMTSVVGGHGVPIDVFVNMLDSDIPVFEDGGIALEANANGTIARRGGVGLVGTTGQSIGTAMVEILDKGQQDHLPVGKGMNLGHGELWRLDGEDRPTALYANNTAVARIRALGETSGDEVIDLAQKMRLRIFEPRSGAGDS